MRDWARWVALSFQLHHEFGTRRSLLSLVRLPVDWVQPKQFRKMIQQTFQQYALLKEEECIMKFLGTLSTFANIDQESYRCELIVSI